MATRSLLAAVSGIEANQTYLDEIGNDIANADTVGYKAGTVQFGDLLSEQISGGTAPGTGSGGMNPVAVGSGVRVVAVTTQLSEGTLDSTGDPTDVAVTGSGYLVVQLHGQQQYTRDGALTLDAAGDLTTLSGGLVQGWQANAAGVINDNGPLGAIAIPKGEAIGALATTELTLDGNLPAWSGTGTPPVVTTTLDAYDALGTAVPVTVTFTGATTANHWKITATVEVPGKTPEPLFTQTNPPAIAFDPTTGQGASITGATTNKTGSFSLPVGTMPTAYSFPATDKWTLDFPAPGSSGAVTQYGGSKTLQLVSQNGYPSGTLETYSIGSDGVITGSFSNGKSMAIGQIALAGFTNAAGLADIGNGLLVTTPNSGQPQSGAPGTGLRGTLLGGQLEESNVDMGTELTDLITAQEAYQANTKVISTSQQVIQALEQA